MFFEKMRNAVHSSRFVIAAAFFLFAALWFCFAFGISTRLKFSEFNYFAYCTNYWKLALTAAIIFLTSVFLPKRGESLAEFMTNSCWILTVIPVLALYVFMDESSLCALSVYLGFLIMAATALKLELPAFSFKTNCSRETLADILLAATLFMALSVLVAFLLLGGWRFFNLEYGRIYEMRRGFYELLGRRTIISYLVSWSISVFLPFALTLACFRRRYFLLALALLLQGAYCFMTNNRICVVIPFVALGVWVVAKYKIKFSWLLLALGVWIIVSTILYRLANQELFLNLMVRRPLLIPAILTYKYFEYFSIHPPTLMVESFPFRLFCAQPAVSYTHLIGEYLTGHPECNANNHVFATAYAFFRLPGVAVFSFLAGVALNYASKAAKGCVDNPLGMAAVAMPLLNLFTSADLSSVLLSGGLGVGVLMLSFSPKAEKEKEACA